MSEPPEASASRQPRRPRHYSLGLRGWFAIGLVGAVGYVAVPPSEGCACGTPTTYRHTLKSDLRSLITSEEAFFADSVRYSRDLERIGFTAAPGLLVTVDSATSSGYRATARFRDSSTAIRRRAGTCVLWVGDSSLAEPTVPEGEPRCWVPRRPRWRYGSYGAPEPVLQ